MSVRTAIESAAITLRAHVYSAVPRDTACCCGWDYGWQHHDREGAWARHVAEQLAVVGALGGAGEVTTEWGVRWVGDDGADEVEVHDDDRGTAEVAARATAGEVVHREVRTSRGPWLPSVQASLERDDRAVDTVRERYSGCGAGPCGCGANPSAPVEAVEPRSSFTARRWV